MDILFINADYYDYDKAIARGLRKLDNEVDEMRYLRNPSFLHIYYSYLAGTDPVEQANRSIQQSELNRVIRRKNTYDVVLVTSGQALLPETLKTLRHEYSEALFVWYLWDNIRNINTFGMLREYYDIIISFDKKEAEREGFYYLPDFYIYGLEDTDAFGVVDKIYDMTYVGMYNESRYNYVKKLIDTNKSITPYIYFYRERPKGIRAAISNLIAIPRHIEPDPYIFDKKLSYDEMMLIVRKSKCILDIASPNQTGLSMRPYEALAFNTKIISTNETVKEMDFYGEENIAVLDKDNPVLPGISFFEREYHTVPREIVEKYSLGHWCKTLMNTLNSYNL